MAALPPLRAGARRLLLATLAAAAAGIGLGYLAHIWPAPEPLRVAFPVARPDVALYAADVDTRVPGRDRRCMLFLDAWMRMPNWELSIIRTHERDGAPPTTDLLTISDTGQATFRTGDAEPRAVFLRPPVLARLHAIAGASCEAYARSADRMGLASLHWGPISETPGALVQRGSLAYARIEAFVDEVSVLTEPPPTPLRLPEP